MKRSPRRDEFWWWVTAAAVATTIVSVSIPVAATVHDVPVLAAFAVGLLQGGSIMLSVFAPRWAIASWIAGEMILFILGSATAVAPWPVDACGIVSLCVLLVALGLRRPVREGLTAWALASAVSVTI
jgi:hypothetical protein